MKEFLLKLFHQYPSVKFAVDLMSYGSEKYFQIDELVLLFLQLDQHLHAIEFIDQLVEEKHSNFDKEEAEKLQICSDILKKYSYLADEKVIRSSGENRILAFESIDLETCCIERRG